MFTLCAISTGRNKAWQSTLTGVQCLYFTTGLLTRWKAYYPLLPTLIRLLGLQAICWPATHYTLVFLQYDGHSRPLLCWTVIGTTTCVSCSLSPSLSFSFSFFFRSRALSRCGSLRISGNGTTPITPITITEARPPLSPGGRRATKNGAAASGIGTRSPGNVHSPRACVISSLHGQCSSRGSCTAVKGFCSSFRIAALASVPHLTVMNRVCLAFFYPSLVTASGMYSLPT